MKLFKPFVFNTCKSIVSDVGASTKLGPKLVHDLMIPKNAPVLVVTDTNILQTRLELGCLSSMKDEGFDVVLFKDVLPNPPEKNVFDCVSLARDVGARCIVGFGGGSVLDVAKLTAFLAHKNCKQSLSDIYGVDMCRGPRLPLVQIPTTAGTGSEVTPISIITTPQKEKKGIVSSILLPDLAVLDGRLTSSLPADVTAYTGIDAMVHALEAYTSKIKKNIISDVFARESLSLLSKNIEEVFEDGNDMEARSAMLLGSCLAGLAFANAPVGAVHALAYPIGSLFNVPHGLSISLMLPHVIRFNSHDSYGNELYSEIAPVIFPDLISVPNSHRAEELASRFEKLAQKFNLPTKLSQVGVKSKDISDLTKVAMKQTRLLPNNIRELGPKHAATLFEQAL